MAVNALRNDKNVPISTLNRAPGSPLTAPMESGKTKNMGKIDQSKLTAKQKLEYLSSADGFQIIFNDFIKVSIKYFSVVGSISMNIIWEKGW